MRQDDRWLMHYKTVMQYMDKYKRCPSKHRLEDHRMLNWVKYTRKLLANGKLSAERTALFAKLQATAEQYRHVNQYV